MKEVTSTSKYKLVPEGNYILTVVGVPEKKLTAKGSYRIWSFRYEKMGESGELKVLMFPWKSEELLLAVGGVKVGVSDIEWDDNNVDGKMIECDLYHEADNNGKVRERIGNIRPFVPTGIQRIDRTVKKDTAQEQIDW